MSVADFWADTKASPSPNVFKAVIFTHAQCGKCGIFISVEKLRTTGSDVCEQGHTNRL